MPAPTPLPRLLLTGAFTQAQAAELGVTRQVLQGQRFQRLFRQVYAPAHLATDPDVLRRGALLLVPHGALSHVSAAQHWGIPLPPAMQRDPVHVGVPLGSERTRTRGLVAHELRLQPGDVVVDRGLRVTTPQRTLTDLAPWLSLADLVAAIDHALRVGLVTPESLAREVDADHARRGVRRLRQAAALADPRAESPQESRLRVVVVCSGLPVPEANVDVYDDAGRWLARGDLVFRDFKIILEYDGTGHLDDAQRKRDLVRRNQLHATGWILLTFSADSMRVPGAIAQAVWDALRSRGWRSSRTGPRLLESSVVRQPRRPR